MTPVLRKAASLTVTFQFLTQRQDLNKNAGFSSLGQFRCTGHIQNKGSAVSTTIATATVTIIVMIFFPFGLQMTVSFTS